MIYKKLTTLFATVAVVATLLVAAPYANAQSTTSQPHQGFFQGLIQFIEQKFGLDKTQVQSAVSEYKAQRQANITPRPTMSAQQQQDREKARLDKLVQQGKITSDQETAIINELNTLHTKYPVDANATAAQRRTQMQSMMNDLKAWATSQNINLSYVMPGFGGGMMGRRGMHRGGGKWATPSATVTPAPTQ